MILSSKNLSKENRQGTLLKMLLIQMSDDPLLQEETFHNYAPNDKYEKLYAKYWLNITQDSKLNSLPLHNLISMLANREQIFDTLNYLDPSNDQFDDPMKMKRNIPKKSFQIKENELKIVPELVRIMQMSLHPPHAIEKNRDTKGYENDSLVNCIKNLQILIIRN